MEDSGNDSVAVSIPDRNILKGDSAKVNGGYRSLSTKWAALTEEIITMLEKREQVVKPPEQAFFLMWDHFIFPTACTIAVLIDPLLFYIVLVNDNLKCIDWDMNLAIAYTILRSTTDLFYAMDLFFSIPKLRKKFSAMIAWQKKNYQIALNLLLQFGRCFGLFFVVLPIPQVITYINDLHPNFLFTLFAIQYMERVCLIYLKLKQCPNIQTGIGRWLKAILDFFPFILAAHLFGAMWYNLALNRQLNCWRHACLNDRGCDLGSILNWNCTIDRRFRIPNTMVLNLIDNACPIHSPNATIFDFGIYLYALQSKMARSKNIIPKMLQGFWWGLRNLSSFGSNLQTSFYCEEIILATSLSISGIVLFLIYLNERLQVPMLEKMNERVLKAICNHLEPMTYSKNSYIIRDGEPLWSMLFITQGSALTYKTSSDSNVNIGASTSDSSISDCLQKGDFYGEELLNWAFTFASFSKLPISTRTIISQTKLEAFSINASDLKSVVSRFQFYFSLMNRPHLERSHLAASFLQLAWGSGGQGS